VQKQNQAKPQSENPQGDKKKSSRPHYRRRRGNGGGNAGK
jgi:hypothetical protein